jgi:acetyltransferase-like isoleucine patch superfamily enzyme
VFQKLFGINRYVPWPVHHSSIVTSAHNIVFEKEINPIGYSPCSYIQASNKIIIGTNVIIGPGVSIISDNHNIYDFTKYSIDSPIIINDNSWIGARATILAGVELGEHTIVAAGAVVTKSFKEGNCIIGGVPARKIKEINEYKSSINYYDN